MNCKFGNIFAKTRATAGRGHATLDILLSLKANKEMFEQNL
jgi:hypothetical protein